MWPPQARTTVGELAVKVTVMLVELLPEYAPEREYPDRDEIAPPHIVKLRSATGVIPAAITFGSADIGNAVLVELQPDMPTQGSPATDRFQVVM
jgi:hypothetical protein